VQQFNKYKLKGGIIIERRIGLGPKGGEGLEKKYYS
jgi:hypothetical protein